MALHAYPRIALVNPPNTSARSGSENQVPPLGLASITAALRQAGFRADLFDLAEVNDLSDVRLTEAGLFSYDVYGLTAYTKTFPSALAVAAQLKTSCPTCVVILGGPHVTPLADTILRDNPLVDLIVKGDGEVPMCGLASAIRTGNSLSAVPSVVSRGQTHPVASSSPALDDLPVPARDFRFSPSYSLTEVRRRGQPVAVEFFNSSRGCPKRCSFCSIVVMSPKYRLRSTEALVAEIKDVAKRRPFGHIHFADPNTVANIRRTLEISEALYRLSPDLTWSGTATADVVARNEPAMRAIARNCLSLELGLESGSATVLTRFNKGVSIQQNLDAVAILARAGIDLDLDFIMFDWEQTIAELTENLQFLRQADLQDQFPFEHLTNVLTLYPGTVAQERYASRFGCQREAVPLIPSFVDPAVDRLFATFSHFMSRHRAELVDDVLAADSWCHSALVTKRGDARLVQTRFATILRQKLVPYRVLHALVSAEQTGEAATPSFAQTLLDEAFWSRASDLRGISYEHQSENGGNRWDGVDRGAGNRLPDPAASCSYSLECDRVLPVATTNRTRSL